MPQDACKARLKALKWATNILTEAQRWQYNTAQYNAVPHQIKLGKIFNFNIPLGCILPEESNSYLAASRIDLQNSIIGHVFRQTDW